MFKFAVIIALFSLFGCGGQQLSESDIKMKVVLLKNELTGGYCTGEQVRAPSGKDYVLTAAHCKTLIINGKILAVDSRGDRHNLTVFREDAHSDLMILEGLPSIRGLDIAKTLHRYEHIRTFTHGGGKPTYKTEGALLESRSISISVPSFEDCVANYPKYAVDPSRGFPYCSLNVVEYLGSADIIPGSSGGPVVNNDSELVGVASAAGQGLNFYVSLDDIHNFLSDF